jgi:hypothetical protein
VQIGEIAAPAARNQDLAPGLCGMVHHQHAAPRLRPAPPATPPRPRQHDGIGKAAPRSCPLLHRRYQPRGALGLAEPFRAGAATMRLAARGMAGLAVMRPVASGPVIPGVGACHLARGIGRARSVPLSSSAPSRAVRASAALNLAAMARGIWKCV